MPSITDKFGKASIDNNYALATTVKTARTVGESVLACYDLSRFSTTTPVYFITYKKTTNPTTSQVSVTNQTSWKAIVNPGNNTLTNLTLAPGYTDIGNDIGDFVECIPTSFWGNQLIDGISVHANLDGTLKNGVVSLANINGGSTEGALVVGAGGAVTASPPRLFYMGDKNNDSTGTGITIITWKTKPFDTASGGNAGAGTYTIPVSGYWRFSGRVAVGSNIRMFCFIANGAGTELLRGMDFSNTAAGTASVVNGILKLNAGDVVSLRVYTGSAATFDTGIEQGYFQGEFICKS